MTRQLVHTTSIRTNAKCEKRYLAAACGAALTAVTAASVGAWQWYGTRAGCQALRPSAAPPA